MHRNFIRDIVNSDDSVEQGYDYKDQYPKGELIEKHSFLPFVRPRAAESPTSILALPHVRTSDLPSAAT
jgi:hypothetical protein